ncbi:MAG: monooxygenase, partial [Rhodospirillaceae bacterium]|nr:monooxygenase [Rhodospirillaceae bacterium]
TAEWRAMIKDRYGAEPEITYFESPVIVDNS